MDGYAVRFGDLSPDGDTVLPIVARIAALTRARLSEAVAELAGATGGRLVVVEGAGHLVPAEAPQDVARLLDEHIGAHPPHHEGARA